MFKRYLMVLTMLLALPAFASAWTLNAKTSVSGRGSITPAGSKIYPAGSDSDEYAVVPAAGCRLSRVTLDGVPLTAKSPGKYLVPYLPGKSMRYLVAYLAANTVNITTSISGHGAVHEDNFEPLTNIPLGSARQILITPNHDYKIDSVSAPGATVTDNADGVSKTAVYSDLQSTLHLSATFVLRPAVSVSAGSDVATTGNDLARAATLFGSGTSNQGDMTYAWTGTDLVFGTAANNTTTVYSATPGTYVATLAVTSNGITVTDTATVVVASSLSVANTSCTSCHAGNSAVAAYQGSQHKTVGCQDCHSSNAHSAVATSAVCVTCHEQRSVPRGHSLAAMHCAECHNPHSLNKRYQAPIANTSSATCVGCHLPAMPTVGAPLHTGGAVFHKAQYVSDASLPVTCADCHGGTNTQAIRAQYAGSAHADTAGEAWLHFDWRGANRSACARCHNGSAFVEKLGSENDISNVFNKDDILKPGEVLACSACHTNVGTGALRTPSEEFTINMTKSTVHYDVVGASGLCVRCHSGRETGASIKDAADTTGQGIFFDSHYQPAAGTLYNKSGYDYGLNATVSGHKTLGASINGPCVSCHMAGKNHSFAAAGCGTCHGTTAPALAIAAATMKANYETALNNLKSALAAKGIHYGPVHPFYFTAAFSDVGINVPVTNWAAPWGAGSWKHTMGAAFNYNLLWSEKGAYAHDYKYAMKLIADSIDFINDGVLNGQ